MAEPLKTFLLHDPRVLARFLSRDPLEAAYLLGDLEPPYVQATRWYGAGPDPEAPAAVLLCYGGLARPVLCPWGEGEGVGAILRDYGSLLPGRVRIMAMVAHLAVMEKTYAPFRMRRMIRMGVDRGSFRPGPFDPASIRPLAAEDGEALATLMEHYPGNAFEPAMFREGFYFGIQREGRLVSAAGTHTFSAVHGVAAVGNIVTHRDWRRQGLASAVTSALLARLFREVDRVALNVEESNAAAIQCYEKLGFSIHSRWVEGSFLKRNGP